MRSDTVDHCLAGRQKSRVVELDSWHSQSPHSDGSDAQLDDLVSTTRHASAAELSGSGQVQHASCSNASKITRI